MKLDEAEQPKLLLVNALYDSINSKERGFQLGLLYISSYVEENGFATKILVGEDVAKRILWMLEHLDRHPIIGFYVSADNLEVVQRTCMVIRAAYPEVRLLLGGPEARVDARRLLERRVADFVCTGDGEECTLALLQQAPYNFPSLSEVPNLAYMRSEELAFSETKWNKANLDLDRFPIPRREHYEPQYLDPSGIATARGCVSRCTFCYEGGINKLRRHSVERVIEEMEYLKSKYGTRYFAFTDDTFTSDQKRVYALCEAIRSSFEPHTEIGWYGEVKVSDLSRNPAMAKEMVNAGMIRAQIGSESGNQEILDLYKKGIRVDQIKEAVSLLYEAGITSIFTNFIIGGVRETQGTFSQSLELAMELMDNAPGVVECASTYLSPYKGTDIRNNPDRYGIEIIDPEFHTGSSDSYIFARSKHLSQADVLNMGKVFYSELRRKMEDILPNLSNETIKRQLEASRLGLTSNWYQFLIEDRVFSKWSNFLRAGCCTHYDSDMSCTHMYIPIRTFDLELCVENHFEWRSRKKRVKFSAMERYLIELASGKITLAEALDLSFDKFGMGKVSRDNFNNDVVAYYNALADEFLLCYQKYI